MTTVLELRRATKTFSGNAAFRNVDFSLEQGEIHALLGENGAGKSTLTKVLAGLYRLSSGEMLQDGAPASFASPADALSHGVAMVFQETNLVPSMTVAQNIVLGNERTFNRLRGLTNEAQQFLQGLNFPVDPTALVSTLGAAKKQMVEIARAVHHKARVIIFDEPTATLTPEEKFHFFNLVNRLKAQGTSIIFISHALEEALELSDRITVLRDGEVVITGPASAFDRARIIQAMVGRSLSAELYGDKDRRIRQPGARVISVENLSMGSTVRNTSFSIFAGQVTGIFGLVGAGRTETMKIVAGVLKRDVFHGGEIRLNGRTVRYRVPEQAVRDGVAYITEDRKLDGIFDTMSIAQNIYIGQLARGRSLLALATHGTALRRASEWIRSLQVRTINANARVVELSGGNQQKVVIAKSLIQKPRLVIFDEPTRGVDVGAIAEIHDLIRKLADEGAAIVVISSYLPEVMSLSDRILVARQGRIVEEMDAGTATSEDILYAAVH